MPSIQTHSWGRRCALALGVVLLMLPGAAACAKQAPTPGTTTAASTSASSTPSATPNPTPTPTPSDTASSWLISAKGIGPYQIGQQYRSTETPPPDVSGPCKLGVFSDPTHGSVAMFQDVGGDQLGPSASAGVFEATMVMTWPAGPGTGGVANPPEPPRTAEGVGPGSTRAQVMAAYPNATPTSGGSGGDALMITQDGVPIIFGFSNGWDGPKAPTDVVYQVEVGSALMGDLSVGELCG